MPSKESTDTPTHMETAIYTLTSALHDEQSVGAVTHEFLGSLGMDYVFKGEDYADYGCHTLNLIYVRTGGTEGIFKRLLSELLSKSDHPFYLLTSGKSNSLAASLEILSYLRQQGLQGEILHGSADYIARRIKLLEKVWATRSKLTGCRLGIIGEPSDWLIASTVNRDVVRNQLGIELIDITMMELLDTLAVTPLTETAVEAPSDAIRKAIPGAIQIYDALKTIVDRHQLDGFTLRCFDLLTAVRNTGCLALARLNAMGIVAGCEGDVPAMLSMMIAQALTGVSGFQANPANIDPETGIILFAHCTIPLNMVERYELDTHFESGIGIGVRGYMKEGPVTILKVAGDLSRTFIAEGQLMSCQAKPDLCRTQFVIRLADPSQTAYFLNHPIGNHHIIVPGLHRELLEEMLKNS